VTPGAKKKKKRSEKGGKRNGLCLRIHALQKGRRGGGGATPADARPIWKRREIRKKTVFHEKDVVLSVPQLIPRRGKSMALEGSSQRGEKGGGRSGRTRMEEEDCASYLVKKKKGGRSSLLASTPEGVLLHLFFSTKKCEGKRQIIFGPSPFSERKGGKKKKDRSILSCLRRKRPRYLLLAAGGPRSGNRNQKRKDRHDPQRSTREREK